MNTFQLPAGYCPITGFRMYAKSAGTEEEKKKKREKYRKQKEQGKVVPMYVTSMSVATEGYIK
ncbi:MAG TPA: hypothetical protein VFT06_10365 [Flavisolibacter sp.]|nr:hypothetical protein [Flavisolibacter sp.]